MKSLRSTLKYTAFTLIWCAGIMLSYAQIGINTETPNTSSALDIVSTDKGMLTPRMNTGQREAISNPANGLVVYDTSTASFWYYDNSEWIEIRNSTQTLNPQDLLGNIPESNFSCLEEIGQSSSSNIQSVAIHNDRAFVLPANTPVLNVGSISDPFNPSLGNGLLLADALSGVLNSQIEVSTDLAFVMLNNFVNGNSDDLLAIVDISDPESSVVINTVAIGNAGNVNIALADNFVFTIDSSEFRIYDRSDPLNLNILGTAIPNGNNEPFGIVVSNNYAYSIHKSATSGFLEIFDVSDSTNPNAISLLGIGNSPIGMDVSGDFVYIVDDESNDLRVIDVSTPSAPNEVGSLNIGDVPTSLDVSGDMAYVGGTSGLNLIDISDPTTPILFNSVSSSQLNDVDVFGSYAYTGSNDGVKVFQLSCIYSTAVDPLSGALIATNLDNYMDNLGDHIATMDVDLANFDITNANQLNVSNAVVENNARLGNISLGNESLVQSVSTQTNNGFTTTPWVYTNAIEAQGERNDEATLITIGNDGVYGADDEIHLVTNGNSRLMVDANGDVSTSGNLSTTDISASTANITTLNIDNVEVENNARLGDISLGNESLVQSVSTQTNNGFTTTPWVYTNAIEAQGERNDEATLITIGNDGFFGADDEIHLVTNGNSRLMVDANGDVSATGNFSSSDISASTASITTLNADDAIVENNARIGDINLGTQSFVQRFSFQGGKGFITVPWVYANAIEAPGERGEASTMITIGNNGFLGGDDQINLVANGFRQVEVDSDGLGIARNPSTHRLEVNGTASKSTAGDWLANSDARLKKNITALDSKTILEKLLTLQGITYEWNDNRTGYDRPKGIQYGFTAQNIQAVFPVLVEEDAEGYLQTAYGTYDAMYVEAIRALVKRLEILEDENEQLKNQNSAYESRLANIEAVLESLATQAKE
ncbi:tail fiber domain-containing protein [Winogradskyella sp.]|uniref:tail fiber domain-containing protein n=1 Tax=Winogradskyella sp. TaxID=1883156 RepID=UPI00262D0D8F|nr:tail fiber domain-containing protein [Winogradskyella sp.]